MSIESSNVATSHKPVGGVDHRGGKKAAKADSAAGDASGGFSMLMGMFSASDGTTDSPAMVSNADATATGSMPSVPLGNDINMPLAQSRYAQPAIYSGVNAGSNVSQPEQVVGQTADVSGLTLNAKGGFQRGNALAAMLGSRMGSDQQASSASKVPVLTAINLQATPGEVASQLPQAAGQLADSGGLTQDTNGGFQRGTALAAMLGNNVAFERQTWSVPKDSASTAINLQVTPVVVETQLPQAAGRLADDGSLTQDANGGFQRSNALSAMLGNPADTRSKVLPAIDETALTATNTVVPTAGVTGAAAQQAAPLVKTNATLAALATAVPEADVGQAALALPGSQPAAKSTSHGPTLSAVQAELRDGRAHPSTVDLAARTEVGSTLAQMNGAVDSALRQQERMVAKSSLARSGDASDGAFGLASGVNARANAPYAIEATAAAVPDTAIAETVSHWATQGVQNAELTLDGFGSDPVEVSISLNGDQAQVDFRTDQADVRQALEAATTELRDLLLSEGLQLAGVSVGSSGGRTAQGNPQQSSTGTKQEALTQEPSPVATAVRASNPSVGRSLDLFV